MLGLGPGRRQWRASRGARIVSWLEDMSQGAAKWLAIVCLRVGLPETKGGLAQARIEQHGREQQRRANISADPPASREAWEVQVDVAAVAAILSRLSLKPHPRSGKASCLSCRCYLRVAEYPILQVTRTGTFYPRWKGVEASVRSTPVLAKPSTQHCYYYQ